MPSGLWLYAYLALWALLLVICVLLVAVLRQVKELHAYWVQNDPSWGLPLGVPAPVLSEEDAFGRPVSLAAARAKKTLLYFLSPGCKTCTDAMTHLAGLREIPDLEVVLVVTAKALETRLFLGRFQSEQMFPDVLALADQDRKVTDRYKVVAVPYVVIVDEEGQVGAKGVALTPGEVASLLRHADELRDREKAGSRAEAQGG